MGRGLSDLQRWILRQAGEHERVYAAEILAGYFGWEPKQSLRRYSPETEQNASLWGDLANPNGQRFSPERIGRERYHRTRVTVSRACTRLSARGFVTCLQGSMAHWAAVAITEAGRDWLSADKAAISPGSQPIVEAS